MSDSFQLSKSPYWTCMPLKFIILLFIKHCNKTYSTFNQQLLLFLKSLEIYCWFLFIVSYLLWVHILLILHQRPPLGLISHKEASFADGMRQGTTSDPSLGATSRRPAFPSSMDPVLGLKPRAGAFCHHGNPNTYAFFCFFVCLSLTVFPTSWDSSDVL